MIKTLIQAIAFTLALLLVSSCVNKGDSNSSKSSSDVLKSYQEQGVGKIISVPPAMAALLLDKAQPGNDSLASLLSNTQKVLFLIAPLDSKPKEQKLREDIASQLNEINFRSIATMDNGHEQVIVKTLSSEGENYSEMVVIVSNHKALVCVSFLGNFSQETVASLTLPKNIDILPELNRFLQ